MPLLAPQIKHYFPANTGAPLSGGKLWTYITDTTTPKTTYKHPDGTAHTNPIILDARGEPPDDSGIYLDTDVAYRFYLTDENDVEIWTRDDIRPSADITTTPITVASVAAMKALTGLADGSLVGTLCFSVTGRGGAWYRASTTVVAADGAYIINNNAGTISFHLIHDGVVHLTQGGGLQDGSTDDLAAWNLLLAQEGMEIQFSNRSMISDEIVIANNNTTIRGLTKKAEIKAMNNADFEHCVVATSKDGILCIDFTCDANKANREASLTTRTTCVTYTSCTNSDVVRVIAKNAIGSASIPGIGITIAGTGDNCNALNCIAIDCGVSGKAADGFFCSSSNSVIQGCKAIRCLDTGHVLESCSFSGIVGCVSIDCGVVGAITNAISSDTYGNFIAGLTGESWNATVTGGVQIGALSSGNLRDTKIVGLVMVGVTQNIGPAVNVRNPSTGRVIGIDLDARIRNASTQGILVSADNANIRASISGTTSACIQVQTGSTRIVVMPGSVLVGGTFGVYAGGTAQVNVMGALCDGNGTGIYADSTSVVTETWNTIINASTARVGKAGGATLNSIGHEAGALSINNATGAAPAGVLVNKALFYDRAGSPLGYVGLYNT